MSPLPRSALTTSTGSAEPLVIVRNTFLHFVASNPKDVDEEAEEECTRQSGVRRSITAPVLKLSWEDSEGAEDSDCEFGDDATPSDRFVRCKTFDAFGDAGAEGSEGEIVDAALTAVEPGGLPATLSGIPPGASAPDQTTQLGPFVYADGLPLCFAQAAYASWCPMGMQFQSSEFGSAAVPMIAQPLEFSTGTAEAGYWVSQSSDSSCADTAPSDAITVRQEVTFDNLGGRSADSTDDDLSQAQTLAPVPVSRQRRDATIQRKSADAQGSELRTTVMLKNLPNNYTREMLLDLIDSEGFVGKYDFFYLPIDFRTHAALGYAFINLVSPEDANVFFCCLNGFSRWSLPSYKVCQVAWSCPHQGFESHIARYRNSPLMHGAVPDLYRPVLFCDGLRIPFPPPTKRVKAPRQGTERMLV